MTIKAAIKTAGAHKRVLGFLVMGIAFMAPAIASAQDHRPPPHHVVHTRKVCHNVRTRDHHGHYHNVRQCRMVRR